MITFEPVTIRLTAVLASILKKADSLLNTQSLVDFQKELQSFIDNLKLPNYKQPKDIFILIPHPDKIELFKRDGKDEMIFVTSFKMMEPEATPKIEVQGSEFKALHCHICNNKAEISRVNRNLYHGFFDADLNVFVCGFTSCNDTHYYRKSKDLNGVIDGKVSGKHNFSEVPITIGSENVFIDKINKAGTTTPKLESNKNSDHTTPEKVVTLGEALRPDKYYTLTGEEILSKFPKLLPFIENGKANDVIKVWSQTLDKCGCTFCNKFIEKGKNDDYELLIKHNNSELFYVYCNDCVNELGFPLFDLSASETPKTDVLAVEQKTSKKVNNLVVVNPKIFDAEFIESYDFRFNNHNVCINPITAIYHAENKKKIKFELHVAKVPNKYGFWVSGHSYNIKSSYEGSPAIFYTKPDLIVKFHHHDLIDAIVFEINELTNTCNVDDNIELKLKNELLQIKEELILWQKTNNAKNSDAKPIEKTPIFEPATPILELKQKKQIAIKPSELPSIKAMRKNNSKSINDTYAGGKNASGVYQFLINHVPPVKCIVSGFLGHCGLLKNIKPAKMMVGIDKDILVTDRWNKEDLGIKLITGDFLNNLDWINPKQFGETLVFLDPPYLDETRASQAKLYNYEFQTTEQHKTLLEKAIKFPCYVMITAYENELYNAYLDGKNGFTKHYFNGQTRAGRKQECMYINYDVPTQLHDYKYQGTDYRERWNNKKLIERTIGQLKDMPALRRNMVIDAILNYQF